MATGGVGSHAQATAFTHPVIVNRIVQHIPSAFQLFALRRLNSAFNAALAGGLPRSSWCSKAMNVRQRMMLEPIGKVSLLKLTNMLRNKTMDHALSPLSVTDVHTHSSSKTMYITLSLSTKWLDGHSALDDFEQVLRSKTMQEGSWKDILIDHPGHQVKLNLYYEWCANGGLKSLSNLVATFDSHEVIDLQKLVRSAIEGFLMLWSDSGEDLEEEFSSSQIGVLAKPEVKQTLDCKSSMEEFHELIAAARMELVE